MRLLLGACLLLGGCYRQSRPACVSDYGTLLIGSEDCEGFKVAERRSVEALAPILPSVTRQVDGVTVVIQNTEDGTWIDSWGRHVSGLTFCDMKTSYLGTDEWSLSALTHELAHQALGPDCDPEHIEWEERGIYKAIAVSRMP